MKSAILGMLSVSLILASCSGGGSGSSTASGGATDGLSGTVAVGAALVNASIIVTGQGCEKRTTTNSSGSYSVSLSSCDGPYLVRAVSPIAILHSVALESDIGSTVNVTPISELVAAKTLGANDLINVTTPNALHITNNLETAKTQVKEVLQPLLDSMGVSNADILKTSFSADGTGFDKVLDVISVGPNSTGGMSLTIKGGSPKEFPSDVVEGTLPAEVSTIELDGADVVADTLSAIKSLMGEANLCLSNIDKQCFVDLSSSTFVENGYVHTTDNAGSDWWTDSMEIEATFYIKLSDPILMEVDDATTPTTAHTMIKVTEIESGQAVYSEYSHVKLVKEAGEWKIAGNGLSDDLNVDPMLVKHGSSKYRVIRIGHDGLTTNYAGMPASYTINFNGTSGINSLTFTKTQDSSGYGYYTAPTNKPGCETDSLYCKSYVDFTNASTPNFIKITINGVDIYRAAPLVIPADSSFPQYTNISSSLCGTGFDTSSYQTSLNFSLPSGHELDGYNLGPVAVVAGFGFDFASMDWNAVETNKSFSLIWDGTGAMDVTSFQTSVTSLDSQGFAYTTIYGCKNP